MSNADQAVAQVGGSHYASHGEGHWDLMEHHDIDYLAGNATKYILRYDRKGTPQEDLSKAKSYLQRMLLAGRGVRRRVPQPALEHFYDANAVTGIKVRLFDLILGLGRQEDIREAVTILMMQLLEIVDD